MDDSKSNTRQVTAILYVMLFTSLCLHCALLILSSVIDTVHVALLAILYYHYTVSSFGDYSSLLVTHWYVVHWQFTQQICANLSLLGP
jgi:uncharacterized membrane protein